MKRVDHPALFDADLPRIEAEIVDYVQFEELLACLDKAVVEIQRDPVSEGAPLTRPPLSTYRKKKFHSMLSPPQGMKADMRLVYRCDLTTNTLFILGVGQRKLRDPDDVYRVLHERSPI